MTDSTCPLSAVTAFIHGKEEWLAARPVAGPYEAWKAWWARRPAALSGSRLWQQVLNRLLPSVSAENALDAPALHWAIPALLSEHPTGLFERCVSRAKAGECLHWVCTWEQQPSMLHALAIRFANWCLSDHPVSQEEWVNRRCLFQAVADRLPLDFTFTEDYPYAPMLLGAAYRFECWAEAARLEALGATPDGTYAIGFSSGTAMELSGVAGWERALALGWDPLAIPETATHPVRRWRHWLGARRGSRNETNTPLVARIVDWARQNDPEGLREWYADAAWRAVKACTTEDAVAEAWVWFGPWLPELLNTVEPHEKTTSGITPGHPPLWQWAMVYRPTLWYSRLAAFRNTGALAPWDAAQWYVGGPLREALWETVLEAGDARSPVRKPNGRFQLLPEPDARALFEEMWAVSRPPPRGLFHVGEWLHSDAAQEHAWLERWLLPRLTPEWIWGSHFINAPVPTRSELFSDTLARLKSVPKEHYSKALVLAARIHPPPAAWRSSVALCAALCDDTDLVVELARSGLFPQDFPDFRPWKQGEIYETCWNRVESIVTAIHVESALSRAVSAPPPTRLRRL